MLSKLISLAPHQDRLRHSHATSDGWPFVLGLFLTVLSADSLRAAIINVPADHSTISAAVTAASPGDEIVVAPGTYNENVTINKSLTLRSTGGRSVTTITGSTGLGTILIQASNVTIGGAGQGFTINGYDSASPGLEYAAVYIQSARSNITLRGNEIVANGEAALLTEFGQAVNNFTVNANIFSGQTFVGSEAGDCGFTNQFTAANVPRQLVNIPTGSGVTFTSNSITGVAGSASTAPSCTTFGQGNTLVTIDASNVSIWGNHFAGTTTRFSASLRARGVNTSIYCNTFDNAGLGAACVHITFNGGLTALTGGASPNTLAGVAAANTFLSEGAYFTGATQIYGTGAQVTAIPQTPIAANSSTLASVTNTNTGLSYCSIQNAIDDVNTMNGHTITIGAGNFVGDLTVNKRLTLDGAGPGSTIVTGKITITASGLDATNRLTVKDLKVTGSTGDGIYLATTTAAGYFTFSNITSMNNADNGIGINATAALTDIEITNCTLSDNDNSGVRIASAVPSITGFSMSGCTVSLNDFSGFIFNPSGVLTNVGTNFSLTNCTFTNNSTDNVANQHDVVFYGFHGNASLNNVSITANNSTSHALVFTNASAFAALGTVTLTDVTVSGTVGKGALTFQYYNDISGVSMSNVDVSGCTAPWGQVILHHQDADAFALGNTALKTLVHWTTGGTNATSAQFKHTVSSAALDPNVLADAFQIADQIVDAIDATGLGHARIKAGHVYVTANSFAAPTTTTPNIQRAIDVASANDIVKVGAGTYTVPINSTYNVAKALSFHGANFGVAGAGTRGAESKIVVNHSSGFAMTIRAGNVTVDGFEFELQLGRDAINVNTPYVASALSTMSDFNFSNNIFRSNPTASGQKNGIVFGENSMNSNPATANDQALNANVTIHQNKFEFAHTGSSPSSRGIVMTTQFDMHTYDNFAITDNHFQMHAVNGTGIAGTARPDRHTCTNFDISNNNFTLASTGMNLPKLVTPTIENNTMAGFTSAAMAIGSSSGGYIRGNTIDGAGATAAVTAISLFGGADFGAGNCGFNDGLTIEQNVISNINHASLPNFRGIRVGSTATGSNAGPNISIQNNSFSNVQTGVSYASTVANTGMVVQENDLSGCTLKAIDNTSALTTVLATCNWFGTANGNTIATKISGTVTFNPWLDSGSDGAGMGFQPTGTCDGELITTNGSITDEDCYVNNDGAINLSVLTGKSPYTFSWSNGFTGEDPSGLDAGMYTVTVTDAYGTTASSTFTVGTDSDLTPPTAVCKNITVSLDASQMATITGADVNDNSSDECSPAANLTLSASPNTFDCEDVGDVVVTLTVTDEGGNPSTCTATVTVLDVLNYAEATPTPRLASDGAALDKMGWSVAVYGDVAISGSPEDKVGTITKQGSAYLYGRNTGSGWGQIKRINATGGAASDFFGHAASLDGDYAFVGADLDNVGANTDQGSAYVFRKDEGGLDNWGQLKQLTASDGESYEYFGNAISASSERALVGANSEKNGAITSIGAAYLYEKDLGGSDNWGQRKKLIASDRAANHKFGSSVTLSGNYAIIGAPGHTSSRGAAYIFEKDLGGSNNWGERVKLSASDAANGDFFGQSASISGDYAIVGAYGKTSLRGYAYIFKNDGMGNWTQLVRIGASDGAGGARFGWQVELQGDYAYVSAYVANNKGAVYVFHKDAGGVDNWGQIAKYVASDGATNDQFGYSLGVSASDLVVGAPLRNNAAATDQGAMYVFGGESCPVMPRTGNAKGAAVAEATADRNGANFQVQCQPNPFRDELTVTIETENIAEAGNIQIQVMDATGRLVVQTSLAPSQKTWRWQAQNAADGLYFVQVAGASGVRILPVNLLR